MADITIQVANNNAVNAAKSTIAISANKPAAPKTDKKEVSKKESSKSRAFGDVISVSKDGDTATASTKSKAMLEEKGQASEIIVEQAKSRAKRASNTLYTRIANEELQEDRTGDATVEAGKVKIDKPNPYIENLKAELQEEIREAENAARESIPTQNLQNIELEEQQAARNVDDKADEVEEAVNTSRQDSAENRPAYEPQITSFDGYTDQQLRQMYLSGSISRYNYDQEMSQRAEKNEAFAEKEQVFREGIVRDIERDSKLSQTADAIDRAFSEDSSDTLTAGQRLDMLEAAQLQNAEEQ